MIHVTSNPFFAFHDDVFPAFYKNAASQPRFPRPSFFRKTIIPDKFFHSLVDFLHIATLELNLNGTEIFGLDINFQKNPRFRKMKVFGLKFFDETNLFCLGTYQNGSIWMDSDYFSEHLILNSRDFELKKIGFYFNSHNSSGSFIEIIEERLDFNHF